MKTKKLSSEKILLVITVIAYVAATLLCCYQTKPEVTTGEFPFSITYEYKGETGSLSGVLECAFSGSDTIHGEHRRYWNSEVTYDNPENLADPFVIEQNEALQTTLSIHENMDAGYFMGDPLRSDYYASYGLDGAGPSIAYYDYKNEIFLDNASQDELPESAGFRIIDFTYPEPIENSFSFAGIKYEADNIIIFDGILVVFFLLCLLLVRRDKSLRYSWLDKLGIFFNFLVGIFAVPAITFMCMMFGIVESDIEIIDQIIYNIPPISILGLALSVVFRRKGYSKTGFFIQFAGILPFALILVLEAIFRFH